MFVFKISVIQIQIITKFGIAKSIVNKGRINENTKYATFIILILSNVEII